MFTKCTVPFGQTFPSSQQFVANQTTPRRRSIYSLTSSQFIPALKEWAPLVAAVRQGDQTVLFRKGGIREPTFAPRAPNFLLFPTAYHTESSLLKPDVRSVYEQDCRYDPRSENVLTVSCIVKTTGLWSTTCGNALSALGPLHICGPEFLDKRLKWRPSQSLTVMQVRAYRLPNPLMIRPDDSFWGCFSWLDLPIDAQGRASLETCTPIMTDEDYAQQQKFCEESMLQLPNTVTLNIPD